jgi:hypothetical protein
MVGYLSFFSTLSVYFHGLSWYGLNSGSPMVTMGDGITEGSTVGEAVLVKVGGEVFVGEGMGV